MTLSSPRRVATLVLLLLSVLWLADQRPAAACSCAFQTPEEALATADAAFVGTLVDQRGEAWTFDVDAVLAGELASPLTVRAPVADGANCGLGLAVGARVGLLLYPDETGDWASSGCSTHEPGALLAAGEPRDPVTSADQDPFDVGDEPLRASSGPTGWIVVAGVVAGGLAVLGGVAAWARRTGRAA